MKVHHLNCATMCPIGRRFINGTGGVLAPARMICHCLLIETNDGLILVETGIGLQDVADPIPRLGKMFTKVTRPRLDESETAVRQIQALGFSPDDVRHLIPTHLDLDHASALPDFPNARIHVFQPEFQAAMTRATPKERERYRAVHWAHNPQWVHHDVAGDKWFDFECVRRLDGVPPEVLLVPLIGHTRGHCGVAVQTPGTWLLHAGDAYFHHGELDPDHPHCPIGLKLFQRIIHMDRPAQRQNVERLRDLMRTHPDKVTPFCAHDPVPFDRLQSLAN